MDDTGGEEQELGEISTLMHVFSVLHFQNTVGALLEQITNRVCQSMNFE